MSHQTKNRGNLQAWKSYVERFAQRHWKNPYIPIGTDLRLTLVYLCDDSPADIDNIIKPIQDAMVGIVYEDDVQISDVDSHRRYLTDVIIITDLPKILADAVKVGNEIVYVRVQSADKLGVYL